MNPGNRLFFILGFLLIATRPGVAWSQATDLDCDKCVNSADVATGAITSNKIRNGTITRADIAADTITGNRIKDGTIKNLDIARDTIKSSRIRDGTITTADIAPNAITSNKIKNGTIIDADIAPGTISGAKLASNAVFNSIIVINSDPADPGGNCAQLTATLDMFDAANTVRTLIKLEPGIYDCSNGGASSNVVMKPFVDIEGSGQGVTTILGDSITDGHGVIRTAANTELRFLTVQNTVTDMGTEPHVLNLPVFARISFVTIISADTGGPANEPIDCFNSVEPFPAIVIRNSIVIATGNAATYTCEGGVYISTRIEADNGMGSGTHKCHASFNGAFDALDNSCNLPAP